MILIALWMVSGFLLTIWEMHFDEDVTVGMVLLAMVISVVGPLMLIHTVIRKCDYVLVKKHTSNSWTLASQRKYNLHFVNTYHII